MGKDRSIQLVDVTSSFNKIGTTDQAEKFFADIKEVLERNATEEHKQYADKLSSWGSYIQSGDTFLKFVNEHTPKIDAKSGEGKEIVGSILKNIGNVHWAVAGLSIIGYAVSKYAEVSQNRAECRELLREVIPLVSKILDLKDLINKYTEQFEEALQFIIEASIWCVKSLDSSKISRVSRFFASSQDSQRLANIKSKIDGLKSDFNLEASIETVRHTHYRDKILTQGYPEHAVAIKHQVENVQKLLDMENPNDSSSFAVVLLGLGGIGKSTIAKAVVSFVNRQYYNFAKIDLDERKDYTQLQEDILNDAFPSYMSRTLDLRDAADGKDHITKAFKDEGNKPVFLLIDNVLNKKDLKQILPEDLSNLPQSTKILITTRNKNVIEDLSLECKLYTVKALLEDDALKLLCKDRVTGDSFEMKDRLKEISSLCGGIPLVLKIVRCRLRKQDYNPEKCTQIVQSLKEGEEIKEDQLSERLFDYEFRELEKSTQEAFFDICCFFYEDWLGRHVEYIVGYEEVSFLADAALISTVMANDDKMLFVHNLIRSIGINRSKSSRICGDKDWSDLEKVQANMKEIKGISVEKKSCMLEETHLLSMKDKLRILSWRGSINVTGDGGIRLPQLRCIRTDCDVNWLNVEAPENLGFLECEKLPIKLPKSLRCLKVQRQPVEMQDLPETVPDSRLQELSIEFQEVQRSLIEIIFGYKKKKTNLNAFNRFLQTLKDLKHLEMIKWSSLFEIPEQVCRSPQLTTLLMKSCDQLESLTNLFDQLTTLRDLCLDECPSLKNLPPSFGQLTNLTVLHLLRCESLKELPPTFGQLTTLKKLFLDDCTSLKELPSTFSGLKSLRELEIKWCMNLKELPHNFGELTQLTKLDLVSCTRLEKLPPTFDQLESLRMLNLSYCTSLTELRPSTLENLKSLEYLDISNCYLESDVCQWKDNIKIVK